MVVSQGFYRKIKQWIYSEHYQGVRFRPFQVSGNPYKAKCFLVCAYPDTVLQVAEQDAFYYAEALLNRAVFDSLYGEQCDSKETRGIAKFIEWYESIESSPIIVTYLNALQENGLTAFKLAKKASAQDFSKGERIFNEVLLEFLPDCIVLCGNEAVKMFRKQYRDIIIDYHPTITKAKDLEQFGPFAKLSLRTGRIVYVFACRHMSQYNDEALQSFKKELKNVIKTER